jgi:hypothetical protein
MEVKDFICAWGIHSSYVGSSGRPVEGGEGAHAVWALARGLTVDL